MYHFYAMLSRMKYINRWGLMRNTRSENICEHSLDVAIIAHALALLRNSRFGGSVNPERAAVLAMFHDATEIITGDLPTPVKYDNPEIRQAYRRVEEMAQKRLLSLLPDDLRGEYQPLICEDEPGDRELYTLIKAADKISALIKCVEERGMGNAEFHRAEQAQRETIMAMGLPEADCFLAEFMPSYELTLDEQDLPQQIGDDMDN
ncbi:5'-deoxynucleotidase [Clostridium merdae]|uniref:5'-deoxynucleotidase n=1 Tax=Clostridium merdae TaxID=1958780 RepID=UPI000A27160D|nr:5'-deoxynucleotidase [Clostridium merdae]